MNAYSSPRFYYLSNLIKRKIALSDLFTIDTTLKLMESQVFVFTQFK